MHFPALFSWLRRVGRWWLYELFRLALWLAFALHTIGSLRSALGGGGENGALRRQARPIKPRRPGPASRPRFTFPSPA